MIENVIIDLTTAIRDLTAALNAARTAPAAPAPTPEPEAPKAEKSKAPKAEKPKAEAPAAPAPAPEPEKPAAPAPTSKDLTPDIQKCLQPLLKAGRIAEAKAVLAKEGKGAPNFGTIARENQPAVLAALEALTIS